MKKTKEYVAEFSDRELVEFVAESGKIDPSWQKVFDSALGSRYLRLYSLGQLAACLKMGVKLATMPFLCFGLVALVVLAGLFPSRSGLLLNHDTQLVLMAILSFCLGGIFLSLRSWLYLGSTCRRWRDVAEISWYRDFFSAFEVSTGGRPFVFALQKSRDEIQKSVGAALKIKMLRLQKCQEALGKALEDPHPNPIKQTFLELSEAGDDFAKLYSAAQGVDLCSLTPDQILAEAMKEKEEVGEGPIAVDTPPNFSGRF